MIMKNVFRRLFGLPAARTMSGGRSIEMDPSDMTLNVVGYSADEARDLLAVYREHLAAMPGVLVTMAESHARFQSTDDAVRYRPDARAWPGDLSESGS